MPNTKSAAKRLRQNQKRRMRNRIAKKLIKTYTKRALAAAEAGDREKADADFKMAVGRIDKAGVRRVLHPNTASRRKSKLSRDFQAALTKASAESSRRPRPAAEGHSGRNGSGRRPWKHCTTRTRPPARR